MAELAGNASPPTSYGSPPVPVILTVIFILVFLVGFFSFCFCRCFIENVIHNWYLHHSPSGSPTAPPQDGQANAHPGLEPSVIQSFHTFKYSSVKDLRSDKFGLECAICLLEFDDHSILRLITTCCHVFHQECVDLWLESHNTCPVCRRNLAKTTSDKLSSTPANTSPNAVSDIRGNDPESGSPNEDTFSIDIKDRDNEVVDGLGDLGGKKEVVDRFPRSHSTGHSIIRARATDGRQGEEGDEKEEEKRDKHRLRLPEHLHAKLLRGHHLSCTEFGEHNKDPTAAATGHFGEVSEFPGGNINRV